MATTTRNSISTTNPQTVEGRTIIEDGVVAKVTGLAVREVPGIHNLGGGVARAIGAVRGVVGNSDLTQGVTVEVNEEEAIVDAEVVVVATYPTPLQQLADQVRAAAAGAIAEIIGWKPGTITVTIADVYIASDDESEAGE